MALGDLIQDVDFNWKLDDASEDLASHHSSGYGRVINRVIELLCPVREN